MRLAAVAGNPLVGMYAKSSEDFAIVGVNNENFENFIREELNVEVVRTTIAGSELVGALVAMNSNGVVVSSNIFKKELEMLERKLEVKVIDSAMTCFGNNFCMNDKGGLANPEVEVRIIEEVADFLDIEIVKTTVGGIKTVGMAAVITNKGGLVHPNITEWEKKRIEKVVGVEVVGGTVNFGNDMVGSSIVANSKGCVIGRETTGFELGIIMDALFP